MATLPPFLRQLHPKVSPERFYECAFRHGVNESHSLWWQSSAEEPVKYLLLFIPGNPGLLHFYTPFLNSIHEQAGSTGQSIAILAHSHLGHTPEFTVERSASGLASQVDSAIEAFDAAKGYFGNKVNVVLIGHSVGAWICTQVLRSRPAEVAEVFLLFPTISNIATTPNGRRLSWLFQRPFPEFISRMSVLTNLVPDWLLGYLFPQWPSAQRQVLRSLLRSPLAIKSTLSMAHDEMNTIKDLDTGLIQQHLDHICFYFAENDDWVGTEREVILSTVDTSISFVNVVHGGKDIPHAFCINHGEPLASQCFKWLSEVHKRRI